MDDSLELLLHPVRMRLVHAMRVGGRLTTGELGARLPDLPKATVYRQVERLVRGGVFEVDSERKVRGVVERRYRLVSGAGGIRPEAGAAMSAEEHRQAFAAALSALIGDFGAYLDRGDADPFRDMVSYRQFVLWLTPDERSALMRELGRLVRGLMGNAAGGERAPHMLSTVFFPVVPPAEEAQAP